MISFERSAGLLCGRPMTRCRWHYGPWWKESSWLWLYLRYGVYMCMLTQRDRQIFAHMSNNSSLVSDYCVYFKRRPQNCSGFNARKRRPPWLRTDLALLDANILWQTRLIYLDSSERREVTTYIQDVFTFDTEWGKRSGGVDMHLWLFGRGWHHGVDRDSILLSLYKCMLLVKPYVCCVDGQLAIASIQGQEWKVYSIQDNKHRKMYLWSPISQGHTSPWSAMHLLCWYLCRERGPNDKQSLNGQ